MLDITDMHQLFEELAIYAELGTCGIFWVFYRKYIFLKILLTVTYFCNSSIKHIPPSEINMIENFFKISLFIIEKFKNTSTSVYTWELCVILSFLVSAYSHSVR